MFHGRPSRHGVVLLSAVFLATGLAWGPLASAAAPGAPIRYAYDPNGRLSAVIDPAVGSAKYGYDATGNITSITRRAITVVTVLEVAPDRGVAGTTVSITGTAFSATPSQNTVKFNGLTAPIVSATPTEIVATVPAGATTGTISVTSPSGSATSSTTFSVGSLAPTITGFSPTIGSPGTTLTITGTNFETNPGFDAVRVNSLFAKVSSATTTSLSVVTPPAASGHVSIATPGGTVTSTDYFFVPPPPITAAAIDDTESVSVGASATVSITNPGNDGLIVFDGVAGQRVTMSFSAVSLTNAVTVLSPDGSTLRVAQGVGSGTWFDAITLPVTGTYELWVDGYLGSTGTVTVLVADVPAAATATATLGGPATTVTTTVPGQNAKIFFDGTANQNVSWWLSNVTLAANARIVNPDGSVLRDWAPTGNGDFWQPLTLPQTGSYTIDVDGAGASTGSWGVQIYDVPADATATATIGGPATTVTTTVPGQNAKIFFDGTANQNVSWWLTSLTLAANAEVLNPDGSVLIPLRGTGSGDFWQPLTLLQTGTYTIRIDGAGASTGSWGVQIYDVPADATAIATIGGPATTVTTTVPGQNAKIFFEGAADQNVRWTLTSVTLAASAEVLNPDGSVLIPLRGTGNGDVWGPLVLPQTGTYTIRIDGAGGSTGSFSVRIDPEGTGLGPTTQPELAVLTLTGDDRPLVATESQSAGANLAGWRPDSPSTHRPDVASSLARRAVAGPTTETEDAPPNDEEPPFVTPPPATGPEEWTPGPSHRNGDWRSGRPRSAWEDQSPLLAEPGVTALSGLVLDLRGEPLADVTLELAGRDATTDASGRFLLEDVDTLAGVLEIDGSTASRPGRTYGFFETRVELTDGRTTVLPYTIWMPKLDAAHTVEIPAVLDREVVVTTPKIPGLELHLPAGASVTDEHGQPVTQIGITPIPVDRTPFPLPVNSVIPVYFTIQPGGAYVEPDGAWLVYPNYINASPGARIDFIGYDPEEKGWFVYGQGTVTADGEQVVPDADTRLWEFSGAMINDGNTPPGTGPNGEDDGDPVDLVSGLFVLSYTDLSLPGVMPLNVTRTYRPNDIQNRPFGKGTNWSYGMFLWSALQYQEADLILPDGARIHYVRTSPGTSWGDAVFETTATPDAYYKSRITWNGNGWDLRLRDGTVYVFRENAGLASIRDRYGNQVNLVRQNGNPNGNVIQLTSSSGRWVTLGYDASNRITSVTDNVGRTVGYTYDSAGYLWKVTDPLGGTSEYTYDATGRMKTLKDARLITFLTNDYYPDGKVQWQTLADGTTYQFTYTTDPSGAVIQTDVTDPRGHVRRLTFDGNGYSLSDTSAFGTSLSQTTTYVRGAGNLPTRITDALGRRTEMVYDTSGNAVSVTRLAGTADAATTTTTYEPLFNQVKSITDPLDHATQFQYYADGSLKAVTDARNKVTAVTNNAAGEPLTVKDPTDETTTFEYQFGDLTAAVDPIGHRTRRFVDAAGRVAAVIDPLGNVVRTEFDVLNRPTKISDPLNGLTQFTYDGNGNLLTLVDARNGVTTYTYDLMDRVATRKDPLLKIETYSYDGNNSLTRVVDRAGVVTTYQYDALNRLTFAGFKTQGTAPNLTYESTITYEYDAGNRLRTATDSAAGAVNLTYDDLDRLASATAPQGASTYDYDDAGRRTSATLAGQTPVTYAYDDANRLSSITQAGSAVLFTYDDAGRMLTETLPNSVVATYSYDGASHVTSITYALGATQVGGLTYEYDVAGRRVAVGGSLARVALPAAVGSTTYNAANQLTKWNSNQTKPTYDPNGNMVSDGTYTFVWNARNQLIQVKQGPAVVAGYSYDSLGRRIGKSASGSTTGYAYDAGNFVQEQSGTGTPTAHLLTGGVDQTFIRAEVGGGARTLLTDALGSTVALADGAGVVQTSYTYEPFGKTTQTGAATANTQQFTGRENDGPLYYYRARYYNATFGRFISEDPGEFATSGPNLYIYVADSPTNLVDPSGMVGILGLVGGCALGVLGYVVGNAVSNALTGSRSCPTPEGILGACITGGISGALGGLPLFERMLANGALGLAGNFYSQLTTGAIQNRSGDPIAYVVSGVVGAASAYVPVSGFGQGVIVSGVSGAAAPLIEQGWDQLLRSIRLRTRGVAQ